MGEPGPRALTFTTVRPSPRLAPYIRAFQLFAAADLGTTTVTVRNSPVGAVNLFLNFADPPQLLNRPAAPATATVVGPKLHADWGAFTGHVDLINIEFRPAGACAFFALPLSALTGQIVALGDLWGRWATDAVAELRAYPARQRLPHLERLLVRHLDAGRAARPALLAAVDLIERRQGQIRVAALADTLGMSLSQLERGFKAQIGLTPKQLARLARFTGTIEQIRRTRDHGWADLAAAGGYADQAHLIHEFVALSGQPPASFARTRADFLQDAPVEPA